MRNEEENHLNELDNLRNDQLLLEVPMEISSRNVSGFHSTTFTNRKILMEDIKQDEYGKIRGIE